MKTSFQLDVLAFIVGWIVATALDEYMYLAPKQPVETNQTVPKMATTNQIECQEGISLTNSAKMLAPPEAEEEVRVYVVRKLCECGGEMKPTGMVLTSLPPLYQHKCDKCGTLAVFDKQYPVIEYRGIEK